MLGLHAQSVMKNKVMPEHAIEVSASFQTSCMPRITAPDIGRQIAL